MNISIQFLQAFLMLVLLKVLSHEFLLYKFTISYVVPFLDCLRILCFVFRVFFSWFSSVWVLKGFPLEFLSFKDIKNYTLVV